MSRIRGAAAAAPRTDGAPGPAGRARNGVPTGREAPGENGETRA